MIKGLLNRELENPAYRKRFELASLAFRFEAAFLVEMERRGWSQSKLAKILRTSKSNISRDLNGGLENASLSRLKRIADALGLEINIEVYRKFREQTK